MTDSAVVFLPDQVALATVLDHALQAGWTCIGRLPQVGSEPAVWSYADGDHECLAVIDHALLGVRLVRWRAAQPMPDWLAAVTVQRTGDELVARALDATAPADKLATLCEVAAALAPAIPDAATELVALRLTDPEPAVRWMAKAAVVTLTDRALEAVLGKLLASGAVPDDLVAWAREFHGLAAASVRGDYIADLDTTDKSELRGALRRALGKQHWRRVEIAAARLLWFDMPYRDVEAAAAWAHAQLVNGRVWPAYFAALFAAELEQAAGPPGRGSMLRAEIEPMLAARADAPSRDDLQPILWLVRQRSSDECTAACDRALDAIDAHVRNLEPERLLLRAVAEKRAPAARAIAQRLRVLYPDSVAALTLQAFLRSNDDLSNEAIAVLEALCDAVARRARVPAASELTPGDAFDDWAGEILAYHARRPKFLRRDLVEIHHRRGDAEAALRASERWHDGSDTALAWLDKATILTKLERHADAIAAYTEAIARVDRDGMVLFGGSYDVAWFNRACERAITGDHEGALRDLAEAIRRDKDYADSAREDRYFDSLRSDPRFTAILDGDLDAALLEDSGLDRQRLDQAVLPHEPAEVRAARLRWDRVLWAVAALRKDGKADHAICELLAGALRGEPAAVGCTTDVAEGLSLFVREVTASRGNTMVLTVMALDTVAAGARSLDDALDDLAALCIGAIAEAAARTAAAATTRDDASDVDATDDDAADGDAVEGDGTEGDDTPAAASTPEDPRLDAPFGNPYVNGEIERRLA